MDLAISILYFVDKYCHENNIVIDVCSIKYEDQGLDFLRENF